MTGSLVRKLLRDVRLGLFIVLLLLAAFPCLWALVSRRIAELLKELSQAIEIPVFRRFFFEGPGQIIQALMGGASIDITRGMDLMSIGYIHPLTQTILCVWAIGRSSGAIAGEIDRGTMELLLAQPLARGRLIAAHLCVDLLTIPLLCLALWGGTWLGCWLSGLTENPAPNLRVNPQAFAPALLSVACLLFSLSGYTLWLSSMGRSRGRVLGTAVFLTLTQFLINVIGQLWDGMKDWRPYTVFYYYQPQPMVLKAEWASNVEVWQRLGVLLAVGTVGYLLALWTFCRRDLPAPL
jgi:ABC-2 type transport system permease protein